LTVTNFQKNYFVVDVMPETFHATSLKYLAPNSPVNLERAVMVGGRFGGHFVSGHVDTVGIITKITTTDNAINYTIKPNKLLSEYCCDRGSITIDGTSLTLFGEIDDSISIALIPHTVKNSVIGNKKIGDIVNIEYDMLAKYVKSILNIAPKKKQQTTLTKDFLLENGF
jgi:riboflavin synthase